MGRRVRRDRARVPALIRQHGRDAVAVYLGNPSAHLLALMLYPRALLRALGTRNVYSASTVDQMPKQVSAGLMFGTALSVPVPDLDRTDFLLILGADPFVSNGSLMTAPDVHGAPARASARAAATSSSSIPRRSRTAAEADEHHFIRPGTDALPAVRHRPHAVRGGTGPARDGWRSTSSASTTSSDWRATSRPRPWRRRCGIDGGVIRGLARELAAAPRGRRLRAHRHLHAGVRHARELARRRAQRAHRPPRSCRAARCSRRPPRARPTRAARPAAARASASAAARAASAGCPEVYGELPAACLAEEIETPGDGQIRALITIAGNPVLSTPNGARLGGRARRRSTSW